MNPVRLKQILAELEQQKELLRTQYQQTVGAAAMIAKLLAEFPAKTEAKIASHDD